jgi:hypothetical protein
MFFIKIVEEPPSVARSPGEECVARLTSSAHPHPATSVPRVINVDKNAAYPKAIAEPKAAGILPQAVKLRQVDFPPI